MGFKFNYSGEIQHADDVLYCRPLETMFHPGVLYNKHSPLDYHYPRLLLQISLFIILCQSLHFLLRPLKQPRIVCEIITGVILGPSVLGRSKEFATTMFPVGGTVEIEMLAKIAMLYFIFVCTVKMDSVMITDAGKSAVIITVCGILLPWIISMSLIFLLWKHFEKGITKAGFGSVLGLACVVSMTGFPVLHLVLKELKMLGSDVGRQAMAASMIGDFIGWTTIAIFEAMGQAAVKYTKGLEYFFSFTVLLVFAIFALRPIPIWIIKRTPPGKPVARCYVVGILLSVLVLASLCDMIGATIVYGPLVVGVLIPDGPPLGSAIVDRSETIILYLFMPVFFSLVGQKVDVFALTNWYTLFPLLTVISLAFIARIIGITLPAIYYKTPLREAVSLAFSMNLRGHIELFIYLHWLDNKVITDQSFTLLVLCAIVETGISTPMLRILERKGELNILNRRTSIEDLEPLNELHIVACIHDQGTIPGIVKLVDAIHATKYSPIMVYVLHLVELTGRATPMFIDYSIHSRTSRYARSSSIVSAFSIYEKTSRDPVSIQAFTAVSPYESMYQDICRLALKKKAACIIFPYYVQGQNAHNETSNRLLTMVITGVFARAPCTVGILVERAGHHNLVSLQSLYNSTLNIAVLFFGGADSREVMAIADRIVGKSSTRLNVVRITSPENKADVTENHLDDQTTKRFREKHMRNSNVVYKEVTLKDGMETVGLIREMNNETYDLWVVGRNQEDHMLLNGLSEWNENTVLGVVGDLLSSPDFGGKASVLVVQQ